LFSLALYWLARDRIHVHQLVKLFIAFDIVSQVVLYFIAEFVRCRSLKLLNFCNVFFEGTKFIIAAVLTGKSKTYSGVVLILAVS